MTKQFCPYCMTPVEEGIPCPSCGLTAGAYNPSPHHLPPGTILMDRYMVGRVLGEGGFGITYIGCDLRLELKVAIKEYFPTDKVTRHARASLDVASYVGTASIGYEEGKVRFLGEARTMARMDKQPEIVSVRDFFEDHNTAYIVMEYVNGTTFKELVAQRGGRIPPGELLPMMEPLFSALSAMHQLGLIHRDISPDNLMLEKGALRLLDFGCARESARGTETMTIALKHGYAPIEQYQHKGQGPWTDVYALSATMYYCLTGKTPPQALDRLCEDELILPRKLGINITERQEKALLYGMGIRPHRRFQSVEELHAALYVPDGAPIPDIDDEDPPIRLLPEEPSAPTGEPESSPAGQTVPASAPAPAEDANAETAASDAPEAESVPPSGALSDTPSGTTDPQWTDQIISFLRRNTKAVAISASAVVLVIALVIGFWPRAEHTNTPVSGSTVTTPPDSGSESGGETKSDPFANAVTLSEGGEEELRALLSDDSVSAIILNAPILVTGEELVITKPLHVGPEYGLNFFAPITVGAGGHIIAESELCCDALFRCMDGGTIHITSTGFLSGSGVLWLEHADNLTVDEGGRTELWGQSWSPINGEHYLTADEDSIFADAVHINTIEEFHAANDNWTVPAIVIDSDITLMENVTSQKPVLISEGVTISAEAPPTHDFSNYATWCVNSTLFINRGTLTGSMNLGQWSGSNGTAVINYGTINASLHMDCEGLFLNFGEVVSSDTHVPSTAIVNLGTILHTGESTDRFMDIADKFFNHGEVIIRGEQCHITLANGNMVFNSGSITVEDHGALNVEEHLINSGSIYVCDTAVLDGSGFIEQTTQTASFTVEEGATVLFCGLMTHNRRGIPVILAEHQFTRIPFDWCNSDAVWDAILRHVYSEQELREALDDPACRVVAIDCDLEISGDWVFHKGIAVAGSLTVLDGSLTVSDGGYMISGDTRVENGSVIVEEGGVWLNRSDLVCDELTLRNDGTLFSTGWIHEINTITLDGGYLCNVTGMIDMADRKLHVEFGTFLSLSHLNLHGCEITIAEGGELNSFDGHFSLDSQCRIENHGSVRLHGWEWQEMYLDIDMTNYGELSLADSTELNGSLVNHGAVHVYGYVPVNGTVENHGDLFHHSGNLYAVDGEITGNPPIEQ